MPNTSLFRLLDREWELMCRSPACTRQLRGWARHDPALAGFSDLAELAAHVNRAGDPAASDLVLAALAALAATDDLAARVVLQLLRPGCKAVAEAAVWMESWAERESVAVAAVYDRIRTYPTQRRPRYIAANVLRDALKGMLRSRRREWALATCSWEDLADDELEAETEPPAAEELVELLAWAVRREVLAPDAARLIGLSRICDVPVDQLGRRPGQDPQTVRRRRQRAETALRCAVNAA
jgi:hypothetical protein